MDESSHEHLKVKATHVPALRNEFHVGYRTVSVRNFGCKRDENKAKGEDEAKHAELPKKEMQSPAVDEELTMHAHADWSSRRSVSINVMRMQRLSSRRGVPLI